MQCLYCKVEPTFEYCGLQDKIFLGPTLSTVAWKTQRVPKMVSLFILKVIVHQRVCLVSKLLTFALWHFLLWWLIFSMFREQNRISSSWSGLTSGPLHSLAWHLPFQGPICVACFDAVHVQWMRKGSEIPDKPMSNMPAACWPAPGDQGEQQTWGISELRTEYYLGLCCKALSSYFVGMVWSVRRTTFSVAFNNQIGDFTFTLILMKVGLLERLNPTYVCFWHCYAWGSCLIIYHIIYRGWMI